MGHPPTLPRRRPRHLAVLTEAGWDQIVAAAPGHVNAGQRFVFDGLTDDNVDALARLCDAILRQIDCHPPA